MPTHHLLLNELRGNQVDIEELTIWAKNAQKFIEENAFQYQSDHWQTFAPASICTTKTKDSTETLCYLSRIIPYTAIKEPAFLVLLEKNHNQIFAREIFFSISLSQISCVALLKPSCLSYIYFICLTWHASVLQVVDKIDFPHRYRPLGLVRPAIKLSIGCNNKRDTFLPVRAGYV